MSAMDRIKAKMQDMFVDPEERLVICHACPEYIPLTSTCRDCGCFMVAKARLKNATCPLKKW